VFFNFFKELVSLGRVLWYGLTH